MTRTRTDQEERGGNHGDLTPVADRLTLGSELSEMERLPRWVEALGMRRGISENVKFGIQLCLEEAISNVIRHGYENVAGLEVRVSFNEPLPGKLIFAVEDDAPQFNPLKQLPPATGSHSWPDRIGGQGIRLMRGFASSLEYEALDGGNRLLIGFDRG